LRISEGNWVKRPASLPEGWTRIEIQRLWIAQDQQSLFSYSFDNNVMTIDPVSTANEGWQTFLDVYNQWCSDRNGVPLLNQTPNLTPAVIQKAYGPERIAKFLAARRQFDPQNRLMNAYFTQLFS
jgi:hypothetical protein